MLTMFRVRSAASAEPCLPPFEVYAPTDEAHPSLRRWQLVERIMELNTTATEAYLEDFSEESLAQYLDHLETMGSPRGGRWVRPGDSPAIMVRETEF